MNDPRQPRPWLAFFLSLLGWGGLGFVYLGRPPLAIAALLFSVFAQVAVVICFVYLLPPGWSSWCLCLLATLAVLLLPAVGALRYARGALDGRTRVRKSLDCLFFFLFTGLMLKLALPALAVQEGAMPFRSFYIPSASMQPTLAINDYILVRTWTYTLQRGDVVVFHPPQRSYTGDATDLVKRVVALGGDTVEVKDGKVLVNGQPAPYYAGLEAPASPAPAFHVPAGTMYMLGDNLNNSHDSRYFGPVPLGNAVGKAVRIFYSEVHPDRVGQQP